MGTGPGTYSMASDFCAVLLRSSISRERCQAERPGWLPVVRRGTCSVDVQVVGLCTCLPCWLPNITTRALSAPSLCGKFAVISGCLFCGGACRCGYLA